MNITLDQNTNQEWRANIPRFKVAIMSIIRLSAYVHKMEHDTEPDQTGRVDLEDGIGV